MFYNLLQSCKRKIVNKLFKMLLGDSVFKSGSLPTYSAIKEKIKPCPFCGGEAILQCEHSFVRQEYDIYQCDYAVKCQSCNHQTVNCYPVWFRPYHTSCEGGIQIVDERIQAIYEWNRRVKE